MPDFFSSMLVIFAFLFFVMFVVGGLQGLEKISFWGMIGLIICSFTLLYLHNQNRTPKLDRQMTQLAEIFGGIETSWGADPVIPADALKEGLPKISLCAQEKVRSYLTDAVQPLRLQKVVAFEKECDAAAQAEKSQVELDAVLREQQRVINILMNP